MFKRIIALSTFVLMICAFIVTTPQEAQASIDLPLETKRSVVQIFTPDGLYSGSGTIFSSDGWILTNHHVVDGYSEVIVCILGKITSSPDCGYTALVVSSVYDGDNMDIALLLITEEGNYPSILLPSCSVVGAIELVTRLVGTEVKTIGYPGIGLNTLTEATGTLSGLIQSEYNNTELPVWLKSDAFIAGGISGGAMFSKKGEYLGITSLTAFDETHGARLGYSNSLPIILAWLNAIGWEWEDNLCNRANEDIKDYSDLGYINEYSLATEYIKEGRCEEASRLYGRVREENRFFEVNWFSLASCYLDGEEYEEAEKLFKRHENNNPFDYESWHKRCSLYFEAEDYAKAENVCMDLIEENQFKAEASYILGMIYLDKNKNAKAKEFFNKAYAAAPDNITYATAACDLYVKLGGISEYSNACKQVNKAVDIFTDVDYSHKNREAIRYLKNHNIIGGYEDGTFKPSKTVSRAELLKIILESQNTSIDTSTYKDCFVDISGQWYEKYACYAKEKEWVGGYEDGTFRPDKTVSKVEALKISFNVLGLEVPSSVTERPFTDVAQGTWFAPFIHEAKRKNLLEETGSVYGYDGGMTRASIGEMIYRLMSMKEKSLDVFSL